MKIRFEIDYTIPKEMGAFINRDLLMKYIHYIVIDGVKYNKPLGDSKEVQNFYMFIVKNKMKVTEILMINGCHVFLKDGKYHSYNTYCYDQPLFKITHYAKNGIILTTEQEMFFKRGLKIKRLTENVKTK